MAIQDGSKIKLTYEDYLGFPDDRNRHEIIDGDHYMTPSPDAYHQTLSRRIQFQLYQKIELTGRGEVYDAPMDLLLSEVDVVQPDLMVILGKKRIRITKRNIQCPPDLVVEILSPSTAALDRDLKKALYERSGVPEYWIVDPEARGIEEYRLLEGRYVRQGFLQDEITFLGLCDVKVDLRAVW